MQGRIIGCPACEVQYDQDRVLGEDGAVRVELTGCMSPGAELCAARRRWSATEIPDDRVMDEQAIEYAATGYRTVRLTAAEAAEALRRMVFRQPDIVAAEAALRLGVTVRQLVPIMAAAGVEMTPDEPVRRPRFLTIAAATSGAA